MFSLLKLRRFIFFVSFVLFVGSLVYAYQLQEKYVGYPRKLDATTERVVPHGVNGVTVFVTHSDEETIQLVRAAEVISFVVLIISLVSDRVWPMQSKNGAD